MRRILALALAVFITALTVSPAQAVGLTDGSYNCTTGSFIVTGGAVANGGTCTGVADIPVGVTSISAAAAASQDCQP